jgi:hypothetical protein
VTKIQSGFKCTSSDAEKSEHGQFVAIWMDITTTKAVNFDSDDANDVSYFNTDDWQVIGPDGTTENDSDGNSDYCAKESETLATVCFSADIVRIPSDGTGIVRKLSIETVSTEYVHLPGKTFEQLGVHKANNGGSLVGVFFTTRMVNPAFKGFDIAQLPDKHPSMALLKSTLLTQAGDWHPEFLELVAKDALPKKLKAAFLCNGGKEYTAVQMIDTFGLTDQEEKKDKLLSGATQVDVHVGKPPVTAPGKMAAAARASQADATTRAGANPTASRLAAGAKPQEARPQAAPAATPDSTRTPPPVADTGNFDTNLDEL